MILFRSTRKYSGRASKSLPPRRRLSRIRENFRRRYGRFGTPGNRIGRFGTQENRPFDLAPPKIALAIWHTRKSHWAIRHPRKSHGRVGTPENRTDRLQKFREKQKHARMRMRAQSRRACASRVSGWRQLRSPPPPPLGAPGPVQCWFTPVA